MKPPLRVKNAAFYRLALAAVLAFGIWLIYWCISGSSKPGLYSYQSNSLFASVFMPVLRIVGSFLLGVTCIVGSLYGIGWVNTDLADFERQWYENREASEKSRRAEYESTRQIQQKAERQEAEKLKREQEKEAEEKRRKERADEEDRKTEISNFWLEMTTPALKAENDVAIHLTDKQIEQIALKAFRRISTLPKREQDEAWLEWEDTLSGEYDSYVESEIMQRVCELRGEG